MRCKHCNEKISDWDESNSQQKKSAAMLKFEIHKESCEYDCELDE